MKLAKRKAASRATAGLVAPTRHLCNSRVLGCGRHGSSRRRNGISRGSARLAERLNEQRPLAIEVLAVSGQAAQSKRMGPLQSRFWQRTHLRTRQRPKPSPRCDRRMRVLAFRLMGASRTTAVFETPHASRGSPPVSLGWCLRKDSGRGHDGRGTCRSIRPAFFRDRWAFRQVGIRGRPRASGHSNSSQACWLMLIPPWQCGWLPPMPRLSGLLGTPRESPEPGAARTCLRDSARCTPI